VYELKLEFGPVRTASQRGKMFLSQRFQDAGSLSSVASLTQQVAMSDLQPNAENQLDSRTREQ